MWLKFRSIIDYSKVLKNLNYSKKWIEWSENARVNECIYMY